MGGGSSHCAAARLITYWHGIVGDAACCASRAVCAARGAGGLDLPRLSQPVTACGASTAFAQSCPCLIGLTVSRCACRQWGSAPEGPRAARQGPSNVELGVLLLTYDARERDEWLERFPLQLPGGGPEAARPYDLSLTDEQSRDRREPRCPFTSGRGWDSVFEGGKTGRELYREGREAVWRARGWGLPPDWPEDDDDSEWRGDDGQSQEEQALSDEGLGGKKGVPREEDERSGSMEAEKDAQRVEPWMPVDHAMVTQQVHEYFSEDEDEDA